MLDSLAHALSVWLPCAGAGVVSELVSYPLDMLTTRLQLQNERGAAPAPAGGAAPAAQLNLRQMAAHVVRTEGLAALYAGATVAATRQTLNAGVSVGLYAEVRARLLAPGEDAATMPLWKRAAAGAVTGCCAQLVSNPADVVKVRVQADGRLRLRGGVPRYAGALDAFATIARVEGLRGFYSGLGSSIWRAAIINAAGISSYDATKQLVLRRLGAGGGAGGYAGAGGSAGGNAGGVGGVDAGAGGNRGTTVTAQVVASGTCGLVSALTSAPINVVRTRLMNSPAQYRGMVDCGVQLVRGEGVAALYKGFLPTLQRQVIFNAIFWVCLEEVQRVLGQKRL
jgi:hypothetical protein